LRRSRALLLAAVLGSAAGCAHWRPNPPLARHDPQQGYRLSRLPAAGRNTDSLFVILAFSGGGTRAAALSQGLLDQLARTSIVWKGETKTLLSEVDVISSVSGGTFTALYYALHGAGGFAAFERDFLKRDIQRELVRAVLMPRNWFRLASPNFDRIDLAAELYDRSVFGGATFASLVERGERPFVIANSTDMTVGARFEFTQDQFDPICSDLSGLPLGRAAAASSAFPGLLSALTLKTYTGACGFERPGWYASAKQDPYEVNPRRFLDAERLDVYLAPEKRYVHLIDGGVADNIGLRGPLQALVSGDSAWSVQRLINNRRVEKVVVLAANAKPGGEPKWDRKQNAPGLLEVLKTSQGAPMAHYSFETVERVRGERDLEQQAQLSLDDCNALLEERCGAPPIAGDLQHVDYYVVEVAFDALTDPGQRAYFKGLPTTFALPGEAIDCLRAVAGAALVAAEDFGELLDDLDAEAGAPPPRAAPPQVPAACARR
jgi:predicted acylesterase/phospholipase RssA